MSALPKQLLYQNKVDSMGARPYTSSMQPQGAQIYGVNDVIIINIPANRNTVMSPHDSYLKFSVTATNNATVKTWARLSKAGAHGFIQRLRLFHGSVLIEDLDNYGNLVAMLCTGQRSSDNVTYKGSVTEGFEESNSVSINNVYNINALRGRRIVNPAYAAAGAADLAANGVTVSQTFCIPLVSILGSLGDKYLPLFAMTSAPLRLELQLVASPQIPIIAASPFASFAISNVEFNGSFIELSDQSLSVIQSSQMGGPLTMAVDRYANLVFNAQLQNATTNVSAPVPFKYSSVQAILNTIRAHPNGTTTFDAFGSNNFNVSEYWYQFGSETLPTRHPGTSTNGIPDHTSMFCYFLSALGSPYSLDHNPCISLYTYDTLSVPLADVETANTTAENLSSIAGSFAIAQELSTYPSASQDQMFSGRNTSTEDIYHNIIFLANATTPAVRLDYYCLHNSVIICENGQAQIRF